jgi:transposase InsO family protein
MWTSKNAGSRGVRISMDGKGRYLDNIFIERLWRSLKYEDIFLKAYGSPAEARSGIGAWLTFYNDKRPHQTLRISHTARDFHRRDPWVCGQRKHVDHMSTGLTTARKSFH